MATPEYDIKFFQLLVTYAQLSRKVGPHVAAAGQKLVRDLVDSGCKIERIAKVTGKTPGYIRGVYAGNKTLNLMQVEKVLLHGIKSGQNASN